MLAVKAISSNSTPHALSSSANILRLISDLIDGLRSLEGEKSLAILAGLLAISLSIGMLIFHHSRRPLEVDDYRQRDISYSKCYTAGKGDVKIILEDGEKKYEIYPRLWQGRYDAATVVSKLREDKRARVWLSPEDDTTVEGIATRSLEIQPAVSVAWHRSNGNALVMLAVLFLILGGVSLFAGLAI